MPDKRYIILLSDVDRMVVRQDRDGYDVVQFSVQLEVLVHGRWRKAVRYDSAHGQPHKHVFYPDGTQYKELMAANDNNMAFTLSQALVKKSFQGVHERYNVMLQRMVK